MPLQQPAEPQPAPGSALPITAISMYGDNGSAALADDSLLDVSIIGAVATSERLNPLTILRCHGTVRCNHISILLNTALQSHCSDLDVS